MTQKVLIQRLNFNKIQIETSNRPHLS